MDKRLALPVCLAAAVLCFLTGCMTPVRVEPGLSVQVRQLAEWQNMCSQYAAWIAHDYSTNTVEFRDAKKLYIAASSSANSFIDQVQFDLLVASPVISSNYAQAESELRKNCEAFLAHAHNVTQTKPASRGRGVPVAFAIATITGLVDWGVKLHNSLKAADMQQRQVIAKALEDQKWKPFSELVK